MAQPQPKPNPFSGSEKENFREFELLLRSISAVAALPANRQANFLQLHLRDVALRFFSDFASGNRSKFGTFNNSSSGSVLYSSFIRITCPQTQKYEI